MSPAGRRGLGASPGCAGLGFGLPAPAGPRPRAELSPPLGPGVSARLRRASGWRDIISSPPFCQSNVWCVWPQDAFGGVRAMNSCSLCHGYKRRVSQNRRKFPVDGRVFTFCALLRDRRAGGWGARRAAFGANRKTHFSSALARGRCRVGVPGPLLHSRGRAPAGRGGTHFRYGRTHGRTGRPRNDLLQLGQTRFWKAAKAVKIFC